MTLRSVPTHLDDVPFSEPDEEAPKLDVILPAIPQYSSRLHESVVAAVAATAAMNRDLYQQVDAIVAAHRDHDGLRLVRLSKGALRHRVARSARFLSANRKGELVPSGVNEAVLDAIYSDPTTWHGHFRPIVGISDLPGIRKDGSIMGRGYDPETKMLIDWGDIDYAPTGSTRADASAALARLDDLIDEFPLKSETDRSVMLSLLLSAVHRRLMRVCVAYLINSPESDVGKSLAVNCACALMLGRRAEAQNAPKDDDEFRKRVFSMLRAGEHHIAFDNVVGQFGGEAFDALTTSQRYADRVLGVSAIEKVDNAALLTLTGRNVSFRGDGSSRCARVNLVKPKTRVYKYEFLPEHIAESRGQYVSDCLTISRAYLLAGRPLKRKLREFDDWCARAREPLVWLGLPDPADSITEDVSDEMNAYTEVVDAWYALYGTEEKQIARVLVDVDRYGQAMDPKRDRLKYAIYEIAEVPVDNDQCARKFGNSMKKNMNRETPSGLSLGVSKERKSGGKCWAVTVHTDTSAASTALIAIKDPEPNTTDQFEWDDKPATKETRP